MSLPDNTSTITICPTCGTALEFFIAPGGESIGHCDHCSITLELSGWLKYATDVNFRNSYAVSLASVAKMASAHPANLHYAVVELIRDNCISLNIVEYEFEEAEMRLALKQFARDGYIATVLASDLTRHAAQEMAHQR